MLGQIKKIIPKPIKQAIHTLYQRTIGQFGKRLLFLRMQKKHNALLQAVKIKKRIRIIFLVIHKSVWKFDTLFQKLKNEACFDPIILICPCTSYSDELMWDEMFNCYDFFKKKGYTTYCSFVFDQKRWIDLEELDPDILFFTNPHGLTRRNYYEDAFKNYLSCYAGYGIHVASYDNCQSQYNQRFHNAMWKVYVQTLDMYHGYLKYSHLKEDQVLLTIDETVESIRSFRSGPQIWKNFNTHKKIIFAPHHTIDDRSSLRLGNFVKYAEFIRRLVREKENIVTWAFKPHPLLKNKLYNHSDWGKFKTDEYYNFWESQCNTQICTGEYIDLFIQSDGLIHDSASFLAEYLFADKPMLYLMNNNTRKNLNDFGLECLNVSSEAWSFDSIIDFIDELISDLDKNKLKRKNFIEKYINESGAKPSYSIVIECLKKIQEDK